MKQAARKDWENPGITGYGREIPRALWEPDDEKLRLSLNGDWAFRWAMGENARPKGFFKPEYNVSGNGRLPAIRVLAFRRDIQNLLNSSHGHQGLAHIG